MRGKRSVKEEILVSYLAQPMKGEPSGLRVRPDGTVELYTANRTGKSAWRQVTQLGPKQMAQLRQHLLAAKIFEMPANIAAPTGMMDGSSCRWQAQLDDRKAEVVVQGWNDDNPAASPLRNLVMQLYALISAAQMGKGE